MLPAIALATFAVSSSRGAGVAVALAPALGDDEPPPQPATAQARTAARPHAPLIFGNSRRTPRSLYRLHADRTGN